MRSVLIVLPFLAGCALLDAVTQEKPSSRQQSAIGDTFQQLGTIAEVANDPAAATAGDLATAVQVDHLARLVEPSLSKPTPGRPAAKPAALPGCVADDGATVTIASCDIQIADGRACQVSGTIDHQEAGSGTSYRGSLVLGGTGCPDGNVTFDVTLTGDPSSPTAITGHASFSWHDPDGDSYDGTLELDDIAVTGACTVPSSGELSVSVTGSAEGNLIDGGITLSFHESPGCGIILVE